MPLDVSDRGQDNRIEIDASARTALAGRITLNGSRNRVRVASPFLGHTLSIEMGEDCSLEIESGCHVGLLSIHMSTNGAVFVGHGSSFNGQTRLLLHEPGRIDIGAGCLFGPDVDVTVSDMHSVLDRHTGERLNPARDVFIADRVWLGIGVFVGKGALVGEGAVVGARSFVSGRVPAHALVAGCPVRLLRENVSWSFDLR